MPEADLLHHLSTQRPATVHEEEAEVEVEVDGKALVIGQYNCAVVRQRNKLMISK